MKRLSELPAHELVPRERSLVDAVATGFHWCRVCRRVTDLEGNEFPGCKHCGSHNVKWNPPELPELPDWDRIRVKK